MTKEQTKQVVVEKVDLSGENLADLIVFNDDFNDFDYVVDCFINICKLSYSEALAKTEYIHHRGIGTVKTGFYDEIKDMKDRLVDCGLTAIVARRSIN